MAEDIAISVNDVSKMYKLYDNPMDRLKESLGLSRKKKYKEHYALNHVSFQVHKGETVGIIGTNGSGKSTILKIITGVLSPTGGEVSVNGRISALLELGADTGIQKGTGGKARQDGQEKEKEYEKIFVRISGSAYSIIHNSISNAVLCGRCSTSARRAAVIRRGKK